MLPWLILLGAVGGQAEETKTGVAVQLIRETQVLKEPREDSESYGILPVGTVLTLRGRREGDYLAIRVELEDGNLEGWISRDSIGRDALDDSDEPPPPRKKRRVRLRKDPGEGTSGQEDSAGGDSGQPPKSDEPSEAGDEVLPPAKLRPKGRVRVPKDEGLLIRRESSFFYGLQAGASLVILQDQASNNYLGPGFHFGANGGMFLTPEVPIRVEVGYSYLGGSLQQGSTVTGPGSSTSGLTGTTSISFGTLDLAVAIEYVIVRFEIFGIVQYSYGLGVSDLPNTIQIGTAADISSIWMGAGLGYRFPLSDVVDLAIRLRYEFSFLRSPVGFQTVGLGAFVEFHG